MWHASVLWPQGSSRGCDKARRLLRYVGTGNLWQMPGGRGVEHFRRRLSASEMEVAGTPVDIRGTPEFDMRIVVISGVNSGCRSEAVARWESGEVR